MTTDAPRNDFDESWYLATYADVARGLLSGVITSPWKHYEHFGQAEGRQPKAPHGFYNRVFTYGSYGSNNTGDEAILDGVRIHYPDAIQLFHNKPRDQSPALQYGIARRDPTTFAEGDYLILGGGGLLYDRETVQLMVDLARNALSRGAVVDLLRIGCEAAHESYFDLICELFSLARFASVRSTASQDIIEHITGKRPVYQKDFAFQLKPRVRPALGGQRADTPTFGLALASINEPEIEALARVLRVYTRPNASRRARFVLIPQSRSYFNIRNNDCVTAELLFSRMFPGGEDEDSYTIAPFSADPLTTLEAYRRIDGVISSRYHGLIFSQLVELPSVAMFGNLPKVRSVVDDNPAPGRIIAPDFAGLSEAIDRLYDHVMSNRRPLLVHSDEPEPTDRRAFTPS